MMSRRLQCAGVPVVLSRLLPPNTTYILRGECLCTPATTVARVIELCTYASEVAPWLLPSTAPAVSRK